MPILTRYVAGLTAALALVTLWLGACSSSTTGGTGSSSGSATAYCNAEAHWRERCTNATCGSVTACLPDASCPSTPPPCTLTGLTCDTVGAACLARMLRPEALAKMSECENQLACTGGKEHCIESITLPDSLPSAVAFQSACQAKLQACQVGEETFFCFDLSAMTEEVVAFMRGCLDQPCASIRSCQDGIKLEAFCSR